MTAETLGCGYRGCEEKPTHGVIMGMDKHFLGVFCYQHAESTVEVWEELGKECRIVDTGEIWKAMIKSELRGDERLTF